MISSNKSRKLFHSDGISRDINSGISGRVGERELRVRISTKPKG